MKTLYADLPLTEGEGHIVNLVTLKESDIPFLRKIIVFQDFKLLPITYYQRQYAICTQSNRLGCKDGMNPKIEFWIKWV
jgi:cell division transport system ATP-binding protein